MFQNKASGLGGFEKNSIVLFLLNEIIQDHISRSIYGNRGWFQCPVKIREGHIFRSGYAGCRYPVQIHQNYLDA